MKTYEGVDCRSTFFLTSALVGDEWSASCPGRFTSGERGPGTHWIGSWVGLRASLDDVEKRKFLTLPALEPRPLSLPARSQSLYQLRYPASHFSLCACMNCLFSFRIYGDQYWAISARHVKFGTKIEPMLHVATNDMKHCSSVSNYGRGMGEKFEIMSDRLM
jgi:hypothetical protein